MFLSLLLLLLLVNQNTFCLQLFPLYLSFASMPTLMRQILVIVIVYT